MVMAPNHIHCDRDMLIGYPSGLSPRAQHPGSQLHLLHGSLFDVKCTNFYCNYVKRNDFTDPIVPALAIPKDGPQPAPSSTDKTGAEATDLLYGAMGSRKTANTASSREADISDENVPIPELHVRDLPHCPECKDGLLRPGKPPSLYIAPIPSLLNLIT